MRVLNVRARGAWNMQVAPELIAILSVFMFNMNTLRMPCALFVSVCCFGLPRCDFTLSPFGNFVNALKHRLIIMMASQLAIQGPDLDQAPRFTLDHWHSTRGQPENRHAAGNATSGPRCGFGAVICAILDRSIMVPASGLH